MNDRLKNILEMWGLRKRPPVVEVVRGSLPTTGASDGDFGPWVKKVDGWGEYYEREKIIKGG